MSGSWGVEIGRHISVAELCEHYNALILATGMNKGRRLKGKGFDEANNVTAFDLARWYNGHPDATAPLVEPSDIRSICILGNGNVSLDIGRFFGKTTEQLSTTDIPENVLQWHSRLHTERIEIIGRGSPLHTRFSKTELSELLELTDFQVQVAIEPSEPSPADGNIEAWNLLQAAAQQAPSARKPLCLRFGTRPLSYEGGNLILDDGGSIKVDLIVHAIGQDIEPLEGVPFDSAVRCIANVEGRVEPLPNVFATGWAAAPRLPAVIPAQRIAAQKLAPAILQTVNADDRSFDLDIVDALRGRDPELRVFTWTDWKKLNEAEIENGRSANRPRMKFSSHDDIRSALDKS
ncbi:hypothetical protein ACVDG8_037190 (plasmid) [Mesorhizobium sp. ORM8.1]